MATYLLAAGVGEGPYVNLFKVAAIVALLLAWAAGAQWIDRDTDVVKTRREHWNMIVVSGGVVATFVLFMVPLWRGALFFVGIAFWLLLAGGSMAAYLVHRNGRVVPSAKILTIGHARRLLGNLHWKAMPAQGWAPRWAICLVWRVL